MKIETIWKYLRINDIERTYYFIIELFVNLLVTSLLVNCEFHEEVDLLC
jgi:hypothetical protein